MTRRRLRFAIISVAAIASCVVAGCGGTANSPGEIQALAVKAVTPAKVTLTWTPPSGSAGYVFTVDGTRVSNTWNPAQSSVTFSKQSGTHTYAASSVALTSVASSTVPPPVVSTTTVTTTTTTTTGTTTTTPTGAANVFLSPTGNDATCSRGGSPCRSFDRADAIAQSGDTIQVAPGLYPSAPIDYGAGAYISHSTPATYVCAPGAPVDSVSFTDSVFSFNPGAANITITGSCFHFHILQGGLGGYPSDIIKNIDIEGVHMDVFDLTGVQGFQINGSQIGPIDACFGIGQAASHGAPKSAECDPNNPTEAYWATIPTGTLGLQDEPYIHSNGSLSGITLNNDHFTGMQTKWPQVFHQGGLLLWDACDLSMNNDTFDHNAVYDIELNATYRCKGLTVTGTFFGWPYDGLENGSPAAKLPQGQCQEGIYDPGGTSAFTNINWSHDTFEACLKVGPVTPNSSTYSNVTVTNNTIAAGGADCVAAPGITYGGNTGGCG